jgi:hypothetical protein
MINELFLNSAEEQMPENYHSCAVEEILLGNYHQRIMRRQEINVG